LHKYERKLARKRGDHRPFSNETRKKKERKGYKRREKKKNGKREKEKRKVKSDFFCVRFCQNEKGNI
jgi:hypothetical protein